MSREEDIMTEVMGRLSPVLEVAVMLCIADLERQGGPTDRDIARVQGYLDDFCVNATDLMFKSKKPGQTAERFTQYADAISVLSFAPGGIKVFGVHFEGRYKTTNE